MFPISKTVRLYGVFKKNKVNTNPANAPTIVVNGPSGNIITAASNTAATALDATNQPGVYYYDLLAANNATEGGYEYKFKTTDTTVDDQEPTGLIYCYSWVKYIDDAGGTLNKQANTVSLSGTAGAGTSSTITLTGGVATDDIYIGQTIYIISGTGAGQSRIVKSYVGSTKVATVAQNWVTSPANDSVFVVLVTGRTYVATIADNAITAASIATDAIDNDAIAANAVTEIQTGLATTASQTTIINALPANFADLSITSDTGRVTVGTNSDKTGYYLKDTEHTAIEADVQAGLDAQGYTDTRADYLDTLNGLVSAIWSYAKASAAGLAITTMGRLFSDLLDHYTTARGDLLDNLDAKISDVPTAAEIRTEIDDNSTMLDGIREDTEDIQLRLPAALVNNKMDSHVSEMGADTITSTSFADTAAQEIADKIASSADPLTNTPANYAAGEIGSLIGTIYAKTSRIGTGTVQFVGNNWPENAPNMPIVPGNVYKRTYGNAWSMIVTDFAIQDGDTIVYISKDSNGDEWTATGIAETIDDKLYVFIEMTATESAKAADSTYKIDWIPAVDNTITILTGATERVNLFL